MVILILIVIGLTVLTQVGGGVFLIAILVRRLLAPRWSNGWRRSAATAAIFIVLYEVVSATLVPVLAAASGRVPLPCRAAEDRPFAAGSRLYCILNRNYVDERLLTLLTELASFVDRLYPGTVTLYLDANFPIVNGFPLLPHLSHDDGRKLDLAFYYAAPDNTYLPGTLRSPIGYWAFEQPAPNEASTCRPAFLTLRWDLRVLQGLYPDRRLEPRRTAAALRWLVDEAPKRGLERVFVEPHLARRLGVSSPIIGFQGCRAARHDDHIHIQIGPRRAGVARHDAASR